MIAYLYCTIVHGCLFIDWQHLNHGEVRSLAQRHFNSVWQKEEENLTPILTFALKYIAHNDKQPPDKFSLMFNHQAVNHWLIWFSSDHWFSSNHWLIWFSSDHWFIWFSSDHWFIWFSSNRWFIWFTNRNLRASVLLLFWSLVWRTISFCFMSEPTHYWGPLADIMLSIFLYYIHVI